MPFALPVFGTHRRSSASAAQLFLLAAFSANPLPPPLSAAFCRCFISCCFSAAAASSFHSRLLPWLFGESRLPLSPLYTAAASSAASFFFFSAAAATRRSAICRLFSSRKSFFRGCRPSLCNLPPLAAASSKLLSNSACFFAASSALLSARP